MKSLIMMLLLALPMLSQAEEAKSKPTLGDLAIVGGGVMGSAITGAHGITNLVDSNREKKNRFKVALLWPNDLKNFTEAELDEAVKGFKPGDRAFVYRKIHNTTPANLDEFNKILSQQNLSDLELRKQLKLALQKEIKQGRAVHHIGNVTKEMSYRSLKMKAVGAASTAIAVASLTVAFKHDSKMKKRLDQSDRSINEKSDITQSVRGVQTKSAARSL